MITSRLSLALWDERTKAWEPFPMHAWTFDTDDTKTAHNVLVAARTYTPGKLGIIRITDRVERDVELVET